MQLVGYDMTKEAAKCISANWVDVKDVDVVELHDCFAHNELITYEALGLCEEGEAQSLFKMEIILSGANLYQSFRRITSRGHPLGATGLAQCFELTQQLRGNAGEKQVDGAKTALQHNLGLGGRV